MANPRLGQTPRARTQGGIESRRKSRFHEPDGTSEGIEAQEGEHPRSQQCERRMTDFTTEQGLEVVKTARGQGSRRRDTAVGKGTPSRGANRAARSSTPRPPETAVDVRAKRERTPGLAAGCNKPATPRDGKGNPEAPQGDDEDLEQRRAEQAVEVVRNHEDGTRRRGRKPRPEAHRQATAGEREWTPGSMSMEGRDRWPVRPCRPTLEQSRTRRQGGPRHGARDSATNSPPRPTSASITTR